MIFMKPKMERMIFFRLVISYFSIIYIKIAKISLIKTKIMKYKSYLQNKIIKKYKFKKI